MNSVIPPPGVKVLSVRELTRELKGLLEDAFPSIWVSGEISNLSRAASGHYYLTLKDDEAQIRAVIWRSVGLRLRFEPRDGQDIIARGRVSVYADRGVYQIAIEELHAKGLGAMEIALRQLREKLLRLGYFAPGRKKPLPKYPRRIALVTSPRGAAVRDMLEIFARRWPVGEVWLVPVRVQGDGAGAEIAEAVELLNRFANVDVIVVGRGGGSTEDLWAFNDERVAHAIFYSKVPVVSAVGHEIDVTIADLVADRRALTPSEAAELVSPNRRELLEALAGMEGQLRTLLFQRLERARSRLEELGQRPAFRLPLERIRDHERRLDDWTERLKRAAREAASRARQRLEAGAAQLEALSPLNVLGRGYSLTRKESDRTVVRRGDQVRLGERLVTQLDQGQITSRVEEVAGPPGRNDSGKTEQPPAAERG